MHSAQCALGSAKAYRCCSNGFDRSFCRLYGRLLAKLYRLVGHSPFFEGAIGIGDCSAIHADAKFDKAAA